MRLRFHLDRKEDGLVVLESEPQMRSLFIYSQTSNTKRVPLPYLLFVVRYTKQENKVLYPGIYGSGLHVFCRTEPVTSFNDNVSYLPTDASSSRLGLICTNHQYDNKIYKTLSELVNNAVGLWYGHQHTLDYQPFDNYKWHETTLEMLPNAKWNEAGTFQEALHREKDYGKPKKEIAVSLDAVFIDENWPAKLEVVPAIKNSTKLEEKSP